MEKFTTSFHKEVFPKVSVVMPIRNEEDFIEKSLGAVLVQDYPHSLLEILVVDGMSTDKTRDVINNLISRHADISLRILDNRKQIAPCAMNVGIKNAGGDIIVRVDGHAIIEKSYIRKCVSLLLEKDVDCVGGIIISKGEGFIGKAIAGVMSSPFGVGDSGFRTKMSSKEEVETDTVPFGVFRKEVFQKIGLFNENLIRHQDYEFNYRLRKAGGTIVLLQSAHAEYYVRESLLKLWKQYWMYGIYKGRFIRTYPNSLKFRHSIPPLFVSSLLLCGCLAFFSKIALHVFYLLLCAYFLFIAFGTFTVAMRNKYSQIFILPVVFCCVHFSWGLGVCNGLLFHKKLPQE